MDRAAQERLESYFDRIGKILGSSSRRGSFAMYALGLLGSLDRKTMEGIAAQVCADPDRMDATHQRLHHFMTDSTWSDGDVRLEAARYALEAMTQRLEIQSWIIDDTGFLKQGKHSVGVQRQYTGTAGKITNCQIGVSLTLATVNEHLPIDFELYVPDSWANDPARRKEARIPEEFEFHTKPELALAMIQRADAANLPQGTILADETYGNSSEFRLGLRGIGHEYIVAINSTTTVRLVEKSGQLSEREYSVEDLALQFRRQRKYRRYTWREGTAGSLSARFAFCHVVPVQELQHSREPGPSWLICEWRDGDSKPEHFHLASHGKVAKSTLVRLLKERWRTERAYQDLKGQLGLDHFEGRRFPGWHHHVSVVLACYAFLVAERARRFSPSAERASQHHTFTLAA